MNKIRGKKGDILIGDVIFIILNLVFLSILIIFIVTKANDASRLEEQYAKQIALIIDSAKPVMTIHLNMEDAIKKATGNNQDISKIVAVQGNVITVKLDDKAGYSYSFFNDVDVNVYPDTGANSNEYVIIIDEKK